MVQRRRNRSPVFDVFGFSLMVLAASIVCRASTASESAVQHPSIVLIIADDMAWDDSEPFGNPGVRTPNLAKLAREGMQFNNAILTISSCSPSRASILTGKYPHRTDAEQLHWPLPAAQRTFVERLREQGYWTAAAGKWHLGSQVRDRFDEIRDVDTSGFQLPTGDAGRQGRFTESLDGAEQSGCAQWVPLLESRPKGKPFFLWLAALDPHRDYRERAVAEPHRPENVRLPAYHPDTPAVRADYARYYDEICRLDRFVGEVLDELDRQGVADETIVVFLSDNGRPFPRDKTTLYDSGIKTPMIIRWPQRIKPNQSCDGLVSSVDVAPTFLELSGAARDESLDGISFARLFSDPSSTIREYAFAEKNWHDFDDHARCVRSTQFKYIHNAYADLPNTPPADAVRSPTYQEMLRLKSLGQLSDAQQACFRTPRAPEELYDVRHDPHELTNLAGRESYAEVLRQMRDALAQWRRETGDRVPDFRTADEFDRTTGKPTKARRRPRWSKARMVEAGLVPE